MSIFVWYELWRASGVAVQRGEWLQDLWDYYQSELQGWKAEDTVQELRREYQSGGEKSVTTMLFLLSLQVWTNLQSFFVAVADYCGVAS